MGRRMLEYTDKQSIANRFLSDDRVIKARQDARDISADLDEKDGRHDQYIKDWKAKKRTWEKRSTKSK